METPYGQESQMVPFEEFAAARLPALVRYAALLTGDRELARDIVQEVLIRAHRRWRRVGAVEHPDRYVRRMITNEYFSVRRRKALPTVALTFEALDGPGGPAQPDPADALAERARLWARLASLPRRQRAVIVLRYYEGLSDNEIAAVLDCAPATVRGYASRALAALRIDLAGQDPTGTDRTGTDTAGTDTAGTDPAGTDPAGTDRRVRPLAPTPGELL